MLVVGLLYLFFFFHTFCSFAFVKLPVKKEAQKSCPHARLVLQNATREEERSAKKHDNAYVRPPKPKRPKTNRNAARKGCSGSAEGVFWAWGRATQSSKYFKLLFSFLFHYTYMYIVRLSHSYRHYRFWPQRLPVYFLLFAKWVISLAKLHGLHKFVGNYIGN